MPYNKYYSTICQSINCLEASIKGYSGNQLCSGNLKRKKNLTVGAVQKNINEGNYNYRS